MCEHVLVMVLLLSNENFHCNSNKGTQHGGKMRGRGGTDGVMVVVIRNGHSDQSSNPSLACLLFKYTFGKGMNPTIFSSVIGK